MIGDTQVSVDDEERLKYLLRGSLGESYPLCRHIREVAEEIKAQAEALLASGQSVSLVIASHGRASDGDDEAVKKALEELAGLPVVIVVRLCTNNKAVVSFWEDIDKNVEGLRLDVLDDFFDEADEVMNEKGNKNGWLTYGPPLHRVRELGVNEAVFDALDEKTLNLSEVVELCELM